MTSVSEAPLEHKYSDWRLVDQCFILPEISMKSGLWCCRCKLIFSSTLDCPGGGGVNTPAETGDDEVERPVCDTDPGGGQSSVE